jgi:hypothetical protein
MAKLTLFAILHPAKTQTEPPGSSETPRAIHLRFFRS